MPYRYVLSTDSASEPVTLAEAKAQLRVDFDDDDTYISSLITAARNYIENETGRTLVNQTWVLTLDDFPGVDDKICIEKRELVSVTSIQYVDQNESTQTLASSQYRVVTGVHPGYIEPEYLVNWPITLDQDDVVTVTFVAGYGAAADVPQAIKHAILMMVSNWYEVREPIIVGTSVSDVPMAVANIVDQYRVSWL